MDDGEVGKMVEEIIVVGHIGFDGKSSRFCPGIPISLSLLFLHIMLLLTELEVHTRKYLF